MSGQVKLKSAAVVAVGAGGLGCPALQYLAAAGVGRLGVIDNDVVELSNLQRQILHSDATIGMLKAESAAQAIKRINPNVNVDVHATRLSPLNSQELLSAYDIILDCSDNAPTRYLLSDTAVALGKPLVSGAALKLEGQLCVYNLGPEGPCYRCLFPRVPSPETMGSCAEAGVFGAVTGIVGTLQAVEAIKIIVGIDVGPPSLLLYSAVSTPPFRCIKLRKRRDACPACGKEGQKLGKIDQIDYVQFCGGSIPDYVSSGLIAGEKNRRISVKEFHNAISSPTAPIRIIDVRPKTEFGICHLPNSINVPLVQLVSQPLDHLPQDEATETYVLCRLGNDSQIAAEALRSADQRGSLVVQDVIGGLRSWSIEVDPTFPLY